MAWSYADTARLAALDGIVDLLDGGSVLLSEADDDPLAAPTFDTPAFGDAAMVSTLATATAAALTADTSVTAGTIGKISFRNSSDTPIKWGTVGTSGEDFNVTDNVIPSGATSVNLTSLTISLTLGGS